MRRRMLAITMTVCAAFAVTAVEARAQATAPSAEALLDDFVKAMGGREALAKLNTRVIKARIEVPAAGVSMSVTTWSARPDKMRALIESDVLGRIERGFDGTVGWEVTTTSGPRVYEGAQLDDFARDNRFDGLAAWRDWVVKAETQGAADVDGKPAWKVLVTPKRGGAQTFYFDQASALIVKLETTARTPAGDIPVGIFFSDYRDVGGVRMPHRVRQVAASQELVSTLQSVTLNAEIPAGQFDLPKDIQALLPKK